MSGAHDVSIVIEWDNVRLAKDSRPRAMLNGLREEIAAQDGASIEVLLAHDGRDGDVREAERALAETGVDVRTVAVPDGDYYELKNAGARVARGDLVIFLDCDIVPDRGWLSQLVAPFENPAVAVVAGAPYVEPAGLWGKSMALAWFFESRPGSGPIQRTERILANNIAFRRETAQVFPFPRVSGTSRASCIALSRQLADAGAVVVTNPAARGSHPPPAGVRRAAARALVHGRDTVSLADWGGRAPLTVRGSLRQVGRIVRSVVRDRRKVGLPAVQAPVAVTIAVAYYGLVAAGALLARVAPSAARRLKL